MADVQEGSEEEPKKKGKGGLLIGLLLSVVAGGGAFAFTSGMIGGGEKEKTAKAVMTNDLAFVSLEPMTVSIGRPSERRYLRFRAELEVASGAKSEVEGMLPRVMDVLNTYLQSLEMEDIEDPSSLLTLRSQMRRRIDLVVGGDRVHDLLVMEFVVN